MDPRNGNARVAPGAGRTGDGRPQDAEHGHRFLSESRPHAGAWVRWAVALLDRDGGVVKMLSGAFSRREDAEAVLRWKRRPGVAIVELFTVARRTT